VIRGLVTLALILLPAAAEACAVCGAAAERNRAAFLGTTIFLSLLPLGMIGGGLYWLRKRGREFWGAEFEDRDTPAEDSGRDPAPAERPGPTGP
jgi:hypothetical protein